MNLLYNHRKIDEGEEAKKQNLEVKIAPRKKQEMQRRGTHVKVSLLETLLCFMVSTERGRDARREKMISSRIVLVTERGKLLLHAEKLVTIFHIN